MPANGQHKPWSASDQELFPEDEEATCQKCGQALQLGQMVQERPAFSLAFYHDDDKDCAT